MTQNTLTKEDLYTIESILDSQAGITSEQLGRLIKTSMDCEVTGSDVKYSKYLQNAILGLSKSYDTIKLISDKLERIRVKGE